MDIQKIKNGISPIITGIIKKGSEKTYHIASLPSNKVFSMPYIQISADDYGFLHQLNNMVKKINKGETITFETVEDVKKIQKNLITLFKDKNVSNDYLDKVIKKLNSAIQVSEFKEKGCFLMNSKEYSMAKDYAARLIQENAGLAKEADKSLASLLGHLDKNGNIIENASGSIYTHRIKDERGVLKKIIKSYNQGKFSNEEFNYENAIKKVGDFLGGRIQMKNLTPQESEQIILCLVDKDGKKLFNTFDDFKKEVILYINKKSNRAPEVEEALRALKEKHTEEMYKIIINAVYTGKISMTDINNYGDEISSYFTSAQIENILKTRRKVFFPTGMRKISDLQPKKSLKPIKASLVLGNKKYHPAEIPVTHKPQISYNPLEGNIEGVGKIYKHAKLLPDKAEKENGYSSMQIGLRKVFNPQNSCYCELQMRGETLNIIGQVEHLVYDCLQGKVEKGKGIKWKMCQELAQLPESSKKAYFKYIHDLYCWARLEELGIITAKPKFNAKKIGLNPDIFSFDGLQKIASSLEN